MNSYGEAEPRLTSGGKAGVDGVKFQDWLSILRRCLTSGGEAAAKSSLKLGVAADCGEAGPVVWVVVFFAGHYFLLGAG